MCTASVSKAKGAPRDHGGVVSQKRALFLGTGGAWTAWIMEALWPRKVRCSWVLDGVDNGGVVAQKGALFLGTGGG